MIKKIIAGTLISAMTLFALPNNEIELMILDKAVQKKAIVLTAMQLQGDTKTKFGKLYDAYQQKLMEYRVKELELIQNYAVHYTNMTDENANKLITEWASIEDDQLTLKKAYMSEFKKVMPSSDVIRYFQVENRLQMMNELKISSLIPLAIPQPMSVEAK